MSDEYERGYEAGQRAVGRALLAKALEMLAPGDPWRDNAALIAERADAVAMLRQVCAEHGDNDWPDDLHIGDVIEKHLWRHLPDPEDPDDAPDK